jgi:hypothetical protein
VNKQHEQLLKRAKEVADKLHADTSVSSVETMMSLKDLREHVDFLIESVASDLQMQEDD